jgi:hypothetical protein
MELEMGVLGMYIKINANMYGKYLRIRISSLGSVADPKLFIPDLISTFQIMPDLDPASDPILKPGLLKTGLARLSA